MDLAFLRQVLAIQRHRIAAVFQTLQFPQHTPLLLHHVPIQPPTHSIHPLHSHPFWLSIRPCHSLSPAHASYKSTCALLLLQLDCTTWVNPCALQPVLALLLHAHNPAADGQTQHTFRRCLTAHNHCMLSLQRSTCMQTEQRLGSERWLVTPVQQHVHQQVDCGGTWAVQPCHSVRLNAVVVGSDNMVNFSHSGTAQLVKCWHMGWHMAHGTWAVKSMHSNVKSHLSVNGMSDQRCRHGYVV